MNKWKLPFSTRFLQQGTVPVVSKRYPVSREESVVRLLLKHKPAAALLDPRFSLLDENRNDNELRIP